jgi:hypothetical protein
LSVYFTLDGDSHFTGVKPLKMFPFVWRMRVSVFAMEVDAGAARQQIEALRAELFEQRRIFGNDQRRTEPMAPSEGGEAVFAAREIWASDVTSSRRGRLARALRLQGHKLVLVLPHALFQGRKASQNFRALRILQA